MRNISIAKIEENAQIPTRKHADDAGLDLFSNEDLLIEGCDIGVVGTGISVDIPQGYVGLILSKSRSDFLLGGGVVDAGYQGEIRVKIMNIRKSPLEIKRGTGIAQLLIIPIETPAVAEVPMDLLFAEKSARGESGGIHHKAD